MSESRLYAEKELLMPVSNLSRNDVNNLNHNIKGRSITKDLTGGRKYALCMRIEYCRGSIDLKLKEEQQTPPRNGGEIVYMTPSTTPLSPGRRNRLDQEFKHTQLCAWPPRTLGG